MPVESAELSLENPKGLPVKPTESRHDPILTTLVVGPTQSNCTIIADPDSRRGIVVDPGGDADRIMQEIEALAVTIEAIVLTHCHIDHVSALGELQQRAAVPCYLHKGDKFLWKRLEEQFSRFGLQYVPSSGPAHWLSHGERLPCCNGEVLHTPGHTPGSVCLWFADHNLLIAGDTLFHRGVGRTDIPGGSFKKLEKSIVECLFTLDDETAVIAGHGPPTTIGDEIRMNPFFGEIMG